MISRAAVAKALMRKVPDGTSCCERAVFIAFWMSSSAGLICATKISPACVSETLRVVRLNSRTASSRSSLPTALLIAVVDRPRSSAAARNEPHRTMASTASSSSSE